VRGMRGKGVPTPFSCFVLKCVPSFFKWLVFKMRSHTSFASTTSLGNNVANSYLSSGPFISRVLRSHLCLHTPHWPCHQPWRDKSSNNLPNNSLSNAILSNNSLSNDFSSNASLSKRQFIKPTVYRTTVYRTTVYRTRVYRNLLWRDMKI